ncbi:hypothetical protein FACS1894176_05340 [Bacteroidia bacterium]|nr:hypothetical protein FACS1894176_05340 [Bacteroidia bacterium]
MNTIFYEITTDDFRSAITTAVDIYCSAGITPTKIAENDTAVKFNDGDAFLLADGKMTKTKYIEKHRII